MRVLVDSALRIASFIPPSLGTLMVAVDPGEGRRMPHGARLRSHWLVGMTFVLLALSLVFIPREDGEGAGKPRPVRVMTRNIYLGADLTPLVFATDLPGLAAAGSDVWNQVVATDFLSRARALAAEIRDADPKIIGLQEVALWRTDAPADGPPLLGGTPAEDVIFDFLEILLFELEALGIPYKAEVVQEEVDVEFPTTLGFDARVTLRDVILIRAGLPADELSIANAQSGNFAARLHLPLLGVSVAIVRGWTSVDATINRRELRLVNTHLEAASNCIRTLQAFELLGGPVNTALTTVLIGDLNSAPDDPPFNEPGCPVPGSSNPYDVLAQNDFVDTWTQANGAQPGFTCCNAADLLNFPAAHSERIDHVLTRPGVQVYQARVVGSDPDGRTDDGLWPSDHAGVVAVLAP